jgi:glycosyltransferase involved in cell wall biosynthesis
MIADKYSISLFFPCYKEEANVEPQTLKSISVLSSVTDNYEVIIVNDGSKDRTRQIADSLVQRYPDKVKVIHHPTNLGYGAALQSGFRGASKELVFYTDGDGQFDISEMPALLKFIPEFDIVSCYRLKRQDSFMRKANAFCWGTLVNMLFRFGLRDIDCAFKLYKREIFDNIKMQSTGALIDTEILARAKRKGYKIKQVGVHHYPRAAGTQTGAKISVILRAFKELFTLYRQIIKDA